MSSGNVSLSSHADHGAHGVNVGLFIAAFLGSYFLGHILYVLHYNVVKRNPLRDGMRNRLDSTRRESSIEERNIDKAVIDSLPKFAYKLPREADAHLECSVCLREFEEDEEGRSLPNCNHSFHAECIRMWLLSHFTCPLCRIEVTPKVVQQKCEALAEDASPSLLPEHLADAREEGPNRIEPVEMVSGSSLLRSTETASTNKDNEGRLQENQSIPHATHLSLSPNHANSTSPSRSPSLFREFSSTRSLNRIELEKPRGRTSDAIIIPRCGSLNLTRYPSTDDEEIRSARGQPVESPPSMRALIMRLLSKERRRILTDQEAAAELPV